MTGAISWAISATLAVHVPIAYRTLFGGFQNRRLLKTQTVSFARYIEDSITNGLES